MLTRWDGVCFLPHETEALVLCAPACHSDACELRSKNPALTQELAWQDLSIPPQSFCSPLILVKSAAGNNGAWGVMREPYLTDRWTTTLISWPTASRRPECSQQPLLVKRKLGTDGPSQPMSCLITIHASKYSLTKG